MSLMHDRLSGIVVTVAPSDAAALADARRAGTRIQRLHHHAVFTKDAEATRHFYEDILELKMVLALVDEGEIDPGAPSPFLHIFFELGDGSMLAFFAAPNIQGAEGYEYPKLSIFDHHLAVRVPDFETQLYYRKRLEAEGYKIFKKQHGFCNSIYVDDPNGVHMELSYDTPECADHFHRAERASQSQLKTWLETRERERQAKARVSEPALA
jgi:glyoxylase I family protein